jgi:hypothetical protein
MAILVFYDFRNKKSAFHLDCVLMRQLREHPAAIDDVWQHYGNHLCRSVQANENFFPESP